MVRFEIGAAWACDDPAQLARVSSVGGDGGSGGDGHIDEHGACALLTRAAGVDQGPCQLDICFEQPMRVQALRVESSARMLEIYALDASNKEADPFGYICTQRGARVAAGGQGGGAAAADGTAAPPPRFSVGAKVLRAEGGAAVVTSVLRLRFLSLQGASKAAMSLWALHLEASEGGAGPAGPPHGALAGDLQAPPGAHQMITMLMRGMGSLASARPSPGAAPVVAARAGGAAATAAGSEPEDAAPRAAVAAPAPSALQPVVDAAALDSMKAEIMESVAKMVHVQVKSMGDTLARIFERRIGVLEGRLSSMEQKLGEQAAIEAQDPSRAPEAKREISNSTR